MKSITESIDCIICEQPIATIQGKFDITICNYAICRDCFETRGVDYILAVIKELRI